MYPENPEGTRVIVGSVNMGYVFDTTRTQTRNLICLKHTWSPVHTLKFEFWSLDIDILITDDVPKKKSTTPAVPASSKVSSSNKT